MKIWKSFSADHSARLKIVGEFKTAEDSNKFVEQITDFIKEVSGDEDYKIYEQLENEVFRKHNHFGSVLGENDVKEAAYFSEDDIEQKNNNKILVETSEIGIGFIMKLIISNGGKVEVLSYHDYPEEYYKTKLL